MTDPQFYPTPFSLSVRASAKFQRPIVRLLEPSGGKGDLLKVIVRPQDYDFDFAQKRSAARFGRRIQEVFPANVDCVEVDLNNCAILRSQGFSVVGTDFLQFTSPAIYSHILMNPPFHSGADHVLHAWNNILRSGELVAILNAETLRNPYSKQRQLLARIVNEFSASEPEYLDGEFDTDETERRTTVEVVIIHLEKKSTFNATFINGLRKEQEIKLNGLESAGNTELMLPTNELQNILINFNCAVEALKSEAIASARLKHYLGRLGRSLLEGAENGQSTDHAERSASDHFNTEYIKLKQRAWTRVLRCSNISERLSSGALKRVEEEFELISSMEFNMDNVMNFIGGIIEQASTIQRDMVCDVFDLISRYAPENRFYYMGWKSNQKHRTNAFRIKTTRFIQPLKLTFGSLSWDDMKVMGDFDKVFAMLDSKRLPQHGLQDLFGNNNSLRLLQNGERLSTDYFDVRCYFGRGTVHLFPKRPDLIDRLNVVVGKHRQWLPEEECQASPAFWAQFNNADKINAKLKIQHIREHDIRQAEPHALQQLDEAFALAMQNANVSSPELQRLAKIASRYFG